MEEVLYIYDEQQNSYLGLDVLRQFEGVKQVCQGFKHNQYQILTDSGNLYYLEYQCSFYQIPTWNQKVKEIATNHSITLLLTTQGVLFGFGEDKQQLGLLGNEKCYYSQTPIRIQNEIKSISLSKKLVCSLDIRNNAWNWGHTPQGEFETPQKIINKKFNKICSGLDYIIFTDQQAQILVMCNIFKLTPEYFTSKESWAITIAEQLDSTCLLITEILPNDKYAILLSNTNKMYLLTNNHGRFIIRRLHINAKIHHLSQTENFIYCFWELGQFIRIDKANLYTNESNEVLYINEQLRFKLPETEQQQMNSIQPLQQLKYSLNLPSFLVNKRRFINNLNNFQLQQYYQQYEDIDIHRKSVEIKLSIIQHQSNYCSPNKIMENSQFIKNQSSFRIYYSPQPINKFTTQRVKQTPKTPKRVVGQYLTNQISPFQNNSAKSFVTQQSNSPIKSSVKKANLLRRLIQNVSESITNLHQYRQLPIDFRDRTHSRRSSSVHLEQLQDIISEVGRNNSQERSILKLNTSLGSKFSQHDNKQTNISSLFQSEQDEELKAFRTFEPLEMIEEEYLEYDDETSQYKRVLYRKPVDQEYQFGDSLNQTSQEGKVLLSRKLVSSRINDQEWNKQLDGQLQKIISENEPKQYIEEEIIIQNQKTGLITRKLIRKPFENEEQQQFGEDLNEVNNEGHKIIARRIINNEQSTDQREQEGWTFKESNLERILGTREPIKYIEEEILEINNETGIIEKKIIRRKYDQKKKLEEGQKLLSSKIIENIHSSKQLQKDGWNYNYQIGAAYKIEVILNQEFLFLEEEQLIMKQQLQDRKLIRKLVLNDNQYNDQEFSENIYEIKPQGIRIIGRRYKNDQQLNETWKYNKEKKLWEKILKIGEAQKQICTKVQQFDFNDFTIITKFQRQDLLCDETLIVIGDELKEQLDNGAKILQRYIVDNNDSTIYLNEQGWILNENDILEKIIEITEINQFYEEEIIIQNKKTGLQQRKLIRKPVLDNLTIGDNILENQSEGIIILNRKLITNDKNIEDWIKTQFQLEQILVNSEPIEYIEEEVLHFDKNKGKMIRQLHRRPLQGNITEQGDINEISENGDIIVRRSIVQNLKQQGNNWKKGNQGTYRQIIDEEPDEYIEEEIIVMKDGHQTRKLIRRPLTQEDLNQNFGENLDEQTSEGDQIVGRRIVENKFSLNQLNKEGWKKLPNNQFLIEQDEPTEFIIEEILQYNKDTHTYSRKQVKKPLNKQNETIGTKINEIDQQGNKVISRQIVKNNKSISSQLEEGWTTKSSSFQEKVLEIQEPTQYMIEEVLIQNQKTGMQERKLIRKPYNSQLQVGEELNEEQNGIKVISRTIVQNEESTDDLKQQKWIKNKKGEMELQIIQSEPIQYLEEEILSYNQNTGYMERKLIRRPYLPSKDQNVNIGINLCEVLPNGDKILSRTKVDNLRQSNQFNDWQKLKNGSFQKLLSNEEPQQYIEEEILVFNPKTNKAERKIVRKPFNDEDLNFGEKIEENYEGYRIVARRIVDNEQSMYAQKWKQGQLGQEILISQEPLQFIEEEILVEENGQYTRQKIIRPNDGTKSSGQVINSKIIDNTFTQQEQEQYQKNNKGQFVSVIAQNEPLQYIEEEIIILNKKTGKQERKFIRRPYNKKLEEEKQFGTDLNESINSNTKVVSRKIVDNNHSTEDWIRKGNQYEQIISKQEPITYYEEEVLIVNEETGNVERKLIRKPYQKDKPIGENLQEQDGQYLILSRKIVDNLSTNGWTEKQGQLEKVISTNEAMEYIEEEVIIFDPKTGNQERKIIRRKVCDPPPKNCKILTSKKINNCETQDQLLKSGWIKQQNGQLVKQLAKQEPTKIIIEEVLQLNPQTGLMERKLIKRSIDSNGPSSDTIILSKQIIENNQPFDGVNWNLKNNQYEQILNEDEPEQFIEEEIIIVNPKTGVQERKLIRKPYYEGVEIGEDLQEIVDNNKKVVARRIIPNNQTNNDLKVQGWKKNENNLEKLLSKCEPAQLVEQEFLIYNPITKQMERTLIRRSIEEQDNTFEGNKILSTRIVDNESIHGWEKVGNVLKKIISTEPTQYIIEEVIIKNPKTGKQERRLIKKPFIEEQDEESQDNYIIISKQIVDNDQPLSEQWSLDEDGVQIKKLGIEPSQYIQEEILVQNPKTGKMERKIITREQGSKQIPNAVVLSSKIIENNQKKGNLKVGAQFISEEPEQYIEEEIIINKGNTQERKLIRRPYKGEEMEIGDDIEEITQEGYQIVSRRIVDSKQQLTGQWKIEGQNLVQFIAEEEAQFIEEEILVKNPKTGMLERKLIRRSQNTESEGDKVISRKIVDNKKSTIIQNQEGWQQGGNGQLQLKIGDEPEQYIEEEVIIINKMKQNQERRIIRRPYNGEQLTLGNNLNEQINNNTKVVSRKIVDNDASWQYGQQYIKISDSEPIKLIEEEIIQFNPKTKLIEKIILRKPYNSQLQIGNNINEKENNQKVIIHRRIVDNSDSNETKKQWQILENGQLYKVISTSKPDQFIEEEILEENEGKIIRKIIRKPMLIEEDLEQGDELSEAGNQQKIVSRRILNSKQLQMQQNFQFKNGVYERIIGQNEEQQLIEEEVLVLNPVSNKYERKLIRRPQSDGLREYDEEGNKILSSKIVENNQSSKKWIKGNNGNNMELIISEEPEQFYEEEILVLKNGKYQRMIIRKPFNGNELTLGENLNEGNQNYKVLSRKLVQNEMTQQEQLEWKTNNVGYLEKIISQEEPLQYIEEEILVMDGDKAVRKIVRIPLVGNKKLLLGNVEEITKDGNIIVSRKIIDNNLTNEQKGEWKKGANGNLSKIVSEEPQQYVEEEVIIIDENGRQERKVIRKPYFGEQIEFGENLNEKNQNNIIVGRKLVDNKQSIESQKLWQQKGNQLEQIIVKDEPSQLIVEEVLQYNPQKGVLERKIITRPVNSDQLQNVQILSKKIVDNLQQRKIGEELIAEEPQQYIEEEIIIVNPRTKKQERKLIRRPYNGEDLNLNNQMDELGENGERIVSRKIVQNELDSDQLKEWKISPEGTMTKQIASNEPTVYMEEEIIVVDPLTNEIQRKLVRKPYNPKLTFGKINETNEDGQVVFRKIIQNNEPISQQKKWTIKKDKLEYNLEKEPLKYVEEEILIKEGNNVIRKIIRRPYNIKENLPMGDDIKDGQVVSRNIIQNDFSQEQLLLEGWQFKDGQWIKISKEPLKYIEEEILVEENGQLLRKLVKRPYDQTLLNSNQQYDQNGNLILSRNIIINDQSSNKMKGEGWNQQEKIIGEEPQQFIEEEIIIQDQNGNQIRKIIRKPYNNEDVEIGDELQEIVGKGTIVSRKIVDNDHSLKQWSYKNGVYETSKIEPQQYVEEEILINNNGVLQRKLIRRPYIKGEELGTIKKFDQQGNKIVFRKLIDNIQSTEALNQQGWMPISEQLLEKTLNLSEPDRFIEEEIIILNPKTLQQERKIVRRPYQESDQKLNYGDNLEEGKGNRKVLSRKIVQNDDSLNDWKRLQGEVYEKQICKQEPTKFIEEEILVFDKKTNKMQRKLVRRPYSQEDQKLIFGDQIKEKDNNGNCILARRLIDNRLSITLQQGWNKQEDGTLEKVLSAMQSQKFIEEEILVYNPLTGKQERRLTRKPIMIAEIQELEKNKQENVNENEKVVARRVVDGDFAISSWKVDENGQLLMQLNNDEPLKFIEEEILEVNLQTGLLERKLIRRPYDQEQEENENNPDRIILSRKIINNNQSQADFTINKEGIFEKIINKNEPDQYVEEEIIIINPVTQKQERKIIRRPFMDQDKNAIIGDQIIDEIQQNQKVISRKIISNQCSNEDYTRNKQGVLEKIINSQEPLKCVEEEILQFNKATGQLERKLIRRLFSESPQLGNNLEEVDQEGNIIISRRIVDNLLSTLQKGKDGWKEVNGQLELILNTQESKQWIEEKLIIKNQETGKEEIIFIRRPYNNEESLKQQQQGLILEQRIVTNNLTQTQLFNDGWQRDKNNNLVKKCKTIISPQLSHKLIQQNSSQYYYLEENHMIINPNNQQSEVDVLKYPYIENQNLIIGEALRERDENGDQIISRRIVTNIDPDYNPYQNVEEIFEIVNDQQNDVFSIQKLVNITEVSISKNLNEKQPNGFIIRSRLVINKFQRTEQQGWRKLAESEIPPEIKHLNLQKRAMYQIDEDSQEHRDSQYCRDDLAQQIKISNQQQEKKYVEEEILILNQTSLKYERKLQRRYTNEQKFGDDIQEIIQEVKYLARKEVDFQQDLTKQGWMEISNQTLQKIISKNETLEMISEEYKEDKTSQLFVLIPFKGQQVKIGELSETQINGSILLRRSIVNNRSLAYYINNDFLKNKDGSYTKQIKAGITVKIPKFQEQSINRKQTQRLSQIQSIEQRSNFLKIGEDEPPIVNRTINSDISETDKMFLKQLERGGKKDRSNIYQNILNDDQFRGRINSDKNNKSASTPFSDYVPSKANMLGKMIIKIYKSKLQMSMNEIQLIFLKAKQQKQQCYKQNSTNLVNVLARILYKQQFDHFIDHVTKNIIEFNEDDVIKYNEMLDENKIITMENLVGIEGQAAEPVELNLTPPESAKKIIKGVKPYASSSQHYQQQLQNIPQTFQRKSISSNTLKMNPQNQRSAQRTTTTIKMNAFPSSQSLKARQPSQKVIPFGLDRNNSKKKSKFQDNNSNSSHKLSQTPLSQSYATISQNHSQISIQKQASQEQLVQQQKSKIASQFKRMGSMQTNIKQ